MNKKIITILLINIILLLFASFSFSQETVQTDEGLGDNFWKFFVAILTLSFLALLLGLGLAFAHTKLKVAKNEKIEKIEDVLPSANCGACGYPGCAGYAMAIVEEGVGIDLCSPGGNSTVKKIAQILGVEAGEKEKQVARVHCNGDNSLAARKYIYNGILDCNSAATLFDGEKSCPYGCLGLGSCVRACAFEAVHVSANGIAIIDEEKCTGCGKCVDVCPKGIITLMPARSKVYVACSSKDKAKQVNSYCKVGCIGCKRCVKKCPVDGAINVSNFLARIDPEKCEHHTECVKICPNDCIISLIPVKEEKPQKEDKGEKKKENTAEQTAKDT